MKRHTSSLAAVILIAVAAFAVAIVAPQAWFANRAGDNNIASWLEVARVSPPGEPDAEIECERLDQVDFTYEVMNRGKVPLKGLKIGTKCSCEENGSPPAEVLPGEKASIGFRLRAPRVGLLQRKIPLLVDGSNEPVALLAVALRVKFDPPELFPPPNGLGVTFVKGSESTQEFVLEATEASREPPWIRGLDLDPSDGIEILAPRIDDFAEADPTLIRRRYHFPVANRSLPVGQHMAMTIVRTRDGLPFIRKSPMLRIVVVDSVAIVPNPVVFKCADGSRPQARRIRVVNRIGNQAKVTLANYDHDLLQVTAAPQAGEMAAFDIVPIAAPASERESHVEFAVGDSGSQTLVVRVEPGTP